MYFTGPLHTSHFVTIFGWVFWWVKSVGKKFELDWENSQINFFNRTYFSKSSNLFIASAAILLSFMVLISLAMELFVSVAPPPCRFDLDDEDGCWWICDDDFGLKILTQLNFFDQFVILLLDSLSFGSFVSGMHFEQVWCLSLGPGHTAQTVIWIDMRC